MGCPSAARAAGGAHVIDDSEVETPGLCHVEESAAILSGGGRMATISPGCTSRSHSTIELGGYAAYGRIGGIDDGAIGFSPKIELRPVNAGFGLGIDGAIGFGLRHRRIESASIIVPLSVALSTIVQVNFNIGGLWSAADHAARGFGGAQLTAQLRPKLQLMAESFAWTGHPPGGQIGLRWTIDGGRTDLDLLAARYPDGIARSAVTLGLTLRR